MRYLIISDIHANWEGLQAVLHDAEGSYDKIVCLGDIVGYGPDPNRVTEWAREHVAFAVRGNHDKACTDGTGLVDFSPLAQSAAIWTRKQLSNENANYLRALPQGPLSIDNFAIVHGSPRDEDEYLIENFEAEDAFHFSEERITFFGHTHVQGAFESRHGRVRNIHSKESVLSLEQDAAYLVNPGSAGQPRDQNAAAGYLLYTPGDTTLEFHRAVYAVDQTQSKIRSTGLPAMLADRLALGM